MASDDLVRGRARELYALALADADWIPAEVCARLGWTDAELADSIEMLTQLGLAVPFPGVTSGWSVHSPATAMAQMLESSRRGTEELLANVGRAHAALAQVVTEFQPVHFRQLAEGRIEVAVQPSQIAAILDEASRTCTTELLSMHPGRPLPAVRLAAGDARNRELLQRGVAMRTIQLATSAAVPHVRSHLRQLVGDGCEVRVATTLPMKLIIIDHNVAVVPSFDADTPPDEETAPPAMVLRSPAMVAVLRQFFEHFWATSSDLIMEEGGGTVSGTRHREVVRLLASGLTDEAIARKLGLSDRTVRRIVAELMQQVGAESRFQAGVKMVRLGWLDDEPAPFTDEVVGSTQQVR
jgi:DNA-binding CsgD family transcriptional regulator